MPKNETETETCPKCKGEGEYREFNYWKYYHNPQKSAWVTCRKCGGSGVIKKEK